MAPGYDGPREFAGRHRCARTARPHGASWGIDGWRRARKDHVRDQLKAEAEHGGLYQAVAAGIYRKHRLDVTIRMGGPHVNNAQRATYWNFLRAKFGEAEGRL